MTTQPAYLNPDSVGDPLGPYSHVSTAGDLALVAGQVGLDADGELVGSDLASQARQAFANVRAILESQGAALRSVLKFTTYLVGAENIEPFYAVRAEIFPEALSRRRVPAEHTPRRGAPCPAGVPGRDRGDRARRRRALNRARAMPDRDRRPAILVISLGGTIAMTPNGSREGVSPTLEGEDLVAAVDGISDVADIQTLSLQRMPGAHLGFDDVIVLAARIRAEAASIDGVVVTQGTDTIEETSFALDLLLDDERSQSSLPARCATRPRSAPTAPGTCSARFRSPRARRRAASASSS